MAIIHIKAKPIVTKSGGRILIKNRDHSGHTVIIGADNLRDFAYDLLRVAADDPADPGSLAVRLVVFGKPPVFEERGGSGRHG
jgi:hypothetical protein